MKILLADDHQLIRDGLRSVLNGMLAQSPEFLEASSFEQSRALLGLNPETVLGIVDMRMSGALDGKPLEALATDFPTVPLVVLSGFLQTEVVRALQRVPSVHALVSKSGDPDTLRFVVLQALAGHRVGDANHLTGINALRPAPEPAASLPPRLQEIYAMLRQGKSNKTIAWELQLTEGTIKNYVSAIYRQLNVRNRIEAAWKNEGQEAVLDLSTS